MGAQSSMMAQSAQTINLSGLSLNGPQLVSLSSMDDFIFDTNHVKKYEVFEIEEDLLALSTTWKRLRDEHSKLGTYHGISKLVDRELFKKVTDADREMAAKIRDHYSKKIVMWKLKGQNLSQFREDMNAFIHSTGKVFKENACPLVYRLPEFYEYDIDFEQLANEHHKVVDVKPVGVVTKTLQLEKILSVNGRSSKRKEFWFSDEQDNLVTLNIGSDNPLLTLMNLHCKNPIKLSGTFIKRSRDNIEYLSTEKYTFV